MQHTIRLPTQPSDDGWDRLFGEAVYGVGGDVGVGGEAQVQFAADRAGRLGYPTLRVIGKIGHVPAHDIPAPQALDITQGLGRGDRTA